MHRDKDGETSLKLDDLLYASEITFVPEACAIKLATL